eukprot:1155616-Pelagomonas_calceolata.AAC.4
MSDIQDKEAVVLQKSDDDEFFLVSLCVEVELVAVKHQLPVQFCPLDSFHIKSTQCWQALPQASQQPVFHDPLDKEASEQSGILVTAKISLSEAICRCDAWLELVCKVRNLMVTIIVRVCVCVCVSLDKAERLNLNTLGP